MVYDPNNGPIPAVLSVAVVRLGNYERVSRPPRKTAPALLRLSESGPTPAGKRAAPCQTRWHRGGASERDHSIPWISRRRAEAASLVPVAGEVPESIRRVSIAQRLQVQSTSKRAI